MPTETLEHQIDIEKIDNEIEEQLKSNIFLAFQTDVLKDLISKVQRSVTNKTTIDIYRFIYFDFQPTKIIARAINNDYMIETSLEQNQDNCNFKIIEGNPCSICFPADKLVAIAQRLSGKNTSIEIKGSNATFKSGRPKFDLKCLDGIEFPNPPQVGQSEIKLSINPDVLSLMYERTIYAASTKESRPVLTGVHHRIVDNILLLVSTDSHRLAQYAYDLEGEYEDLSKVIPTSILSDIQKLLGKITSDVSILFCASQVVYLLEDITIYARILEGNFPPTDKLIFTKEQAGATFKVNAGSLKTLINNSVVYNSDQPIILRIKTQDGQMRVNTKEPEVGEFQEDLIVANGQGDDIQVAVNVRYLKEALSRYSNDDYIQMEFMPKTEAKPNGMQPFKATLLNGNPHCCELFVPVRTEQITYNQDFVIENFQGTPEFNFDPFAEDFENIN